MADRDLAPSATAADEPLSFEDGVKGLESILDGPQKEPEESNIQQDPEDEDGEEQSFDDEDDREPVDDDEDDEASDDDDEDDDDEEAPSAVALDDDAVIDLGNGTQASLAELKADYGQVQKRVADFQSDYTRKTEALSMDRQEIETQSQRVLEWAQSVRQQRDFIAHLSQKTVPQPPSPDMMDEDPIGYMKQKQAYETTMHEMQQLNQYAQQEYQRTSAMEQAEHAKRLEAEKHRMFETMPELAKPEKFERFRRDVVQTFMPSYGFTAEEVATISDHRFAKVMRDAISYQKLKASQPKANDNLRDKPPVLRSGKSLSSKGRSAQGKAAKADRLRKTGSMAAAVDALMDFDL